MNEAIRTIEKELADGLSAGGKRPPSERLKAAVNSLEMEMRFLGGSAAHHSIPPPNLTRIYKLCGDLQDILAKAKQELDQNERKTKNAEEKKARAKKVHNDMERILNPDYRDRIWKGAWKTLKAILSGGTLTYLDFAKEVVGLAVDMITRQPKTSVYTGLFVDEHRAEIEAEVAKQIKRLISGPRYPNDIMESIQKKAQKGESLHWLEEEFLEAVWHQTLIQITNKAFERLQYWKGELKRLETEKSQIEKRIKQIKANIDAFKQLCDRIRGLPGWTRGTARSAIDITKTAHPKSIKPGGSVTYTFTVTNPGNCDLSHVDVTDSKCGPVSPPTGDTNFDNKLDPSETWTYNCSQKLAAAGNVIDTATVTAPRPDRQSCKGHSVRHGEGGG